jgi:hypothetical protein
MSGENARNTALFNEATRQIWAEYDPFLAQKRNENGLYETKFPLWPTHHATFNSLCTSRII